MTVHDPDLLRQLRRLRGGLVPTLLVGVGGFLGAVARYAIAAGLPAGFPVGTLAANVLGSFALGALVYEVRFAGLLSHETRLVLGTGFLSSFTTFSTFAVETATLGPVLGTANVVANLGLGLLAALLGRRVASGVA